MKFLLNFIISFAISSIVISASGFSQLPPEIKAKILNNFDKKAMANYAAIDKSVNYAVNEYSYIKLGKTVASNCPDYKSILKDFDKRYNHVNFPQFTEGVINPVDIDISDKSKDCIKSILNYHEALKGTYTRIFKESKKFLVKGNNFTKPIQYLNELKIELGNPEIWVTLAPYHVEGLAKVLEKDSVVKELNTRSVSIGDKNAKEIAKSIETHPSLEILRIERASITAEGTRFIARAIAKNKNIVVLSLAGNDIGAAGLYHLKNAISINTELKTIDLHSCELTDDSIDSVVSIVKDSTVENLSVSFNKFSADATIPVFTALLESKQIYIFAFEGHPVDWSRALIDIARKLEDPYTAVSLTFSRRIRS